MYDKVNPEQMMFLRKAFENKQGEIVAKRQGKGNCLDTSLSCTSAQALSVESRTGADISPEGEKIRNI